MHHVGRNPRSRQQQSRFQGHPEVRDQVHRGVDPPWIQKNVISGTTCFQGDRIFGVDGSEGEGDPGHRQEGMTILDDIGAFDYPTLDSVVDTTLRH